MKTTLFITAVLFLASLAGAQEKIVTTNVPTDFAVNGTVLPAGQYQVSWDGQKPFLVIQDTKSGQHVTVFFRSVKQNCANTEFILAPDKDRQVLHRICLAGDGYAFDVAHGADVYNPVLPE
jgi:hypothetical protein